MSTDEAPPSDSDDGRLAELIDVVIGIAANDFDRRARVGDGRDVLDGLATGLNMLAEEIGQRHAREQAYQQRLLQHERLLAVGQLAAGIAHEINNPAAFVLTNLLVLDERLTRLEALIERECVGEGRDEGRRLLAEAREIARDDVEGVERIVAIVRNLRNFARLEADRVEALALAEVVSEACKMVRSEVAYRAQFTVSVPPEIHVRGDRTKLIQVFTNLLMNSAQAIAEGSVAANAIVIHTEVHGSRATVTIRDTGSGFTPEAQTRLFEPFFTTKPRDQGTGLGLALSADIVRHHGGQLRLVETSAAGTTFEITLPLDGTYTPRAETPPRAMPAVSSRPRVVIIDDEPMLLDAYRRFFHAHFDLTLLPSAREATATFESDDDWDAVVCDLMMPDFDGVALHDWLTKHRPSLLPRTLFYTGGAFTPRSLAFVEHLGHRLLKKPLRPAELRAAVEKVRRQ